MKIAFFAPMKPPDHPTPSGDRRVARLLLKALGLAGFELVLASRLRVYDGQGDAALQAMLSEHADDETARLLVDFQDDPPALWFTYHCYYKAPDLIGPRVAAALGVPYVIAEASRAKKRLDGPWARFAEVAEAAIDAAQLVYAMTPTDREALDRDRARGQRIVDLPPFLDPGADPPERGPGQPLRLLTVAMMRPGAKTESYRALAAALDYLRDIPWRLDIAGDGPARVEIAALFAPFGERVRFLGTVENAADLRALYESADVFVWPGRGEAYGMVYLEAQAAALPVVAEDHPGPRSVIAPGYSLVRVGDAAAFAAAIRDAVGQGAEGRAHVLAHHSLRSAAERLGTALRGLT